jgi:hypothetical protein
MRFRETIVLDVSPRWNPYWLSWLKYCRVKPEVTMSIRRLFIPSATAALAAMAFIASPAFAQSAPPVSDSEAHALMDAAKDAVAADSEAVDALRNDPDASGPDYNRAAMLYHAARSLLRDSDYTAASDSSGSAQEAVQSAAQGVRDLFDRQPEAVGAPPLRDSTVDNTERAVPDGVPQRTFRDSLPFGVQPDSPDGVPQRSFRDSLPFGAQKAQPADQEP